MMQVVMLKLYDPYSIRGLLAALEEKHDNTHLRVVDLHCGKGRDFVLRMILSLYKDISVTALIVRPLKL
jgi:hypothetical protein